MRLIWRCALLVLTVSATAYPARFALLVGNSSGQQSDQQLKYVSNDLSRMRGVLTQLCGFESVNVITLLNAGVTQTRASITALRAQVESSGKDDMLLFYYSGHADAQALRMGGERMPLGEIRDSLSAFPARIRVAMFDACQSGSFTRLKGGTLAPPFLFTSDSRVEGFVVLSSSSASENAQESDALKSSVFTFHLVNALRGSADATGDGRVTLNEAYQYAYNHTVSSTMHSEGGAQHPSYRFELKGEGDVVLADLNVRTSGIVFAPDVEGRVTVIDEGRTVVAAIEKVRGSTVIVALLPGTYDISRREAGETSNARLTVPSNVSVRVTAGNFAARGGPDESSRAKGNDESRKTYVSIGVSAGYLYASLTEPNEMVREEFSSFGAVGLQTSPDMTPSFFQTTASAALWLGGRIGIGAELAYAGSRTTGSDAATQIHLPDSMSYNYALSWSNTLEIVTVAPGLSYRFVSGPLRNAGLRIGLDIHRVSYTISSRYVDGLYRLEEQRRVSDDGLLALPSLSLSYAFAITRRLEAAVMIRYRYQTGARELRFGGDPFVEYETSNGRLSSYEEEPFKYDLGGIAVRVGLTYNLGKRE